jgi:hypothetical protein
VNDGEILFRSGDLYSALASQQAEALRAVVEWDADQLLATAKADLIDYLVAKYSVACPTLDRDRIEQLPVSEEVRTVQDSIYAFNEDAIAYRMTKIVIVVPFTGDKDVFRLHPSQSWAPARAQVREGELRLTWTGDPQVATDAAAVRRHFDGELGNIGRTLSASAVEIDRYNSALRSKIVSSVTQRKAKLLADRELEAGLGFPVRQRSDASQYAVPVNRRRIETPRRPSASGQFHPEPVLPDVQYAQALGVLRNARNALERTPSMTANLDEEKIRDLLLVLLNAQFEGAAAGEVFNAAGKTDILIRAGDRNVFIAECKIWKGPKTIRDALSQLLSYLTWRDTKAALLLFIRTGEPTTIITKSIAEIKGHGNYKRTGSTVEDGERYDVTLHANGDPNREIQLAFLPFALRDAQAQQ